MAELVSPDLSQLIRQLLREETAPRLVLGFAANLGAQMPEKTRRRQVRALIDYAASALTKRQWARAAGHVFVALGLETRGFATVEATGILWDSDMMGGNRRPFLELLAEHCREGSLPSARVETYLALEDLAIAWSHRFHEYRRLLRAGRIGLVKGALASVEMAFDASLSERIREELDDSFPDLPFQPETQEEIASVISRLIAEANKLRTLDGYTLALASADALRDPHFPKLVLVAAVRSAIAECARQVQVLGYTFARVAAGTSRRPSYLLSPPSDDIEIGLRDGMISTQLFHVGVGRDLRAADFPAIEDVARVVAERLYPGLARVDLVHEPFRRFRITIPLIPEMFQFVRDTLFRDDLNDRLVHDANLVSDLTALESLKIGKTIDVARFRTIQRVLRFFCLLHVFLVERRATEDPLAASNSLFGVMDAGTFPGQLAEASGATEAECNEVLGLLTWTPSMRASHLDLQYTPIIRVGAEMVVAPRLLSASNSLRNLLMHRAKRPKGSGDEFTERTYSLFEDAGLPAAKECKLKVKQEGGIVEAEFDVLVLACGKLFMLECKHTIQATEAYELRATWDHLQSAASQLSRGVQLLSTIDDWRQRLRTWFPGVDVPLERPKIVPAIVLSVRTFSGLSFQGAYVRDWFSLRNVMKDGQIRLSRLKDSCLEERVYSFWKGDQFDPGDFDDYMTPEGRYWRTRRGAMRRVDHFDFISDEILIARHSFAAELSADSEHAESLLREEGCRLVSSVTHSQTEWRARLEGALRGSKT